MAVTTTIHIDDAAIAHIVSWNGDFGRSFKRLARMIELRSKSGVPSQYSHVGWLRDSINNNAGSKQNARGLWFYVESKVKYALYVESGTGPHEIRPKNPGGMLVFFWHRVGATVFMKGVKHPGNRAYRYLENGMIKAIATWQHTG